jgi:serine/threonine protein kinase
VDDDRRELQFLGTLGTGGFGAVYLANLHGRDRFVRRVAVKVMREGLEATPDLVARQKDEARLLGLLAHDAIVQVLDLTEVAGRPAVVMEYVEGVDVADVLRSCHPRRLPVRAALEIVHGTASALDAAFNTPSPHTGQPLRVIHRDIKPANLLLTSSGRVKVLDFGVAKADFWREGLSTNGGYGTPRFMAPEQWLGESYGAPVDVYALGVTLYEIVSGRSWERPPLARTPFEHNVGAQLDAAEGVPESVLALLAGMLSFEGQDRPTAAEVCERVDAALTDAPGETLGRFARGIVPGLVEARARLHASQSLPPPVTLGGISRTEERTPELSLVTAPTSTWWRRGLVGTLVVAGAGLLGVSAAVALVAIWAFEGPLAAQNPGPAAGPGASAAPASAAPSAAPANPPLPEAGPAAASPGGDPLPSGTASADAAPATTATAAMGAEPLPTATAPAPTGTAPTGTAPTGPTPHPTSLRGAGTASAPVGSRGAAGKGSAPTASAAAPTSPTVAPSPAAASAVEAPARRKLQITADTIGATVWVDGQEVGKTPFPALLAPGHHVLAVGLDGTPGTPRPIELGPDSPPGMRYYLTEKLWRSVQ